MEYLIISLAALFTSLLTLFSGFGLGTLLMPVFAVFFQIELAIGMTAIVHFLNNLFKLFLFAKYTDLTVVFRFGVPAILTAFIGSQFLIWLSNSKPLFEYELLNKSYFVTPEKFIIAILILVFALFEILPKLKNFYIDSKYLFIGGLLSGFFGGLSGHQGALRSAFLVRLELSKEGFIATGVVIASLIDVTRISVYSSHLNLDSISSNYFLLIIAVFSAFSGAFIGSKLIKKVTIKEIKLIVSVLLLVFSVALGCGFI